jgi:hypothetical protein
LGECKLNSPNDIYFGTEVIVATTSLMKGGLHLCRLLQSYQTNCMADNTEVQEFI